MRGACPPQLREAAPGDVVSAAPLFRESFFTWTDQIEKTNFILICQKGRKKNSSRCDKETSSSQIHSTTRSNNDTRLKLCWSCCLFDTLCGGVLCLCVVCVLVPWHLFEACLFFPIDSSPNARV